MTTTRVPYDPFAPAGAAFPDRRLRRAGLDEASVDRLREAFRGMDREEQRELSRFVSRNTDRSILRRFQGTRTREQLEALTIEGDGGLADLLEERGLSHSGRKAELVDRLLAAYAGAPPTALTANPVPPKPETPESAPSAPETAAQAPAGPEAPAPAPEDESGNVGSPAVAPVGDTQTPAPAPAAADSTTTED